jgi:hypothetical protein
MVVPHDVIPGVTDDPVLRLLLTGKAKNLDEAEEMYLDDSLPEVLELLRQQLSDEELARHPLLTLLRVRGSRGREDSPSFVCREAIHLVAADHRLPTTSPKNF